MREYSRITRLPGGGHEAQKPGTPKFIYSCNRERSKAAEFTALTTKERERLEALAAVPPVDTVSEMITVEAR